MPKVVTVEDGTEIHVPAPCKIAAKTLPSGTYRLAISPNHPHPAGHDGQIVVVNPNQKRDNTRELKK